LNFTTKSSPNLTISIIEKKTTSDTDLLNLRPLRGRK